MFPMLNSIQIMASMKDFDYSRKKLSYFFLMEVQGWIQGAHPARAP